MLTHRRTSGINPRCDRIIQVRWVPRVGSITMSDDGDIEFSVAEDRRYTKEHLWLQVIDREEDEDGNVQTSVKVGVSEYVAAVWGEFIRVTLPNLQALDGFEEEGEKSQEKSGLEGELAAKDILVTLRTSDDVVLVDSPFPCGILELNGEVEDSPDLVNSEAYGDGWLMIVRPHEYDEDNFLSPEEYIEFLAEGL